MPGPVVGYFFSVITVFAIVMTFTTLLIGALDSSTLEKLRHYRRPIIEQAVTPASSNQEPHHAPNLVPHHPLLALGTNDATAPKHLSGPDKNTKDSRAASGAKADAENRKPERNIRPEGLAHLRESKALADQRRNNEGHGIAGALGLVGGLAVYAVDSVLTTLTPQLDAGADHQSAAPASQQKPQPGSTSLPQSILAAEPLGPASQFQSPSAMAAEAASGIARQLGALRQSNQPPSNQPRGNQAPGDEQQVATPAQQQTVPQVSATPPPYAVIANDDDRSVASRRARHPRKQATFTSNAPRYRDQNYVLRYGSDQYDAWSGGATQRFDSRRYDHVYNSYGEPRFGPDARYLHRSRVIPRSPETLYPMQTGPLRREQYWGGGFYGGYRYGD
jgi:hypothetical protein